MLRSVEEDSYQGIASAMSIASFCLYGMPEQAAEKC
jgi:hypothetical protein